MVGWVCNIREVEKLCIERMEVTGVAGVPQDIKLIIATSWPNLVPGNSPAVCTLYDKVTVSPAFIQKKGH